MNIVECFQLSAKRYPQQIAYEDRKRTITYQELDERTNRLGNLIISLGLAKGDNCGILLFNSIEYMECLIGLAKAGVTSVPINFRFSSSEIEYIVQNAEVKALITSSDFLPVVSEASLDFGPQKILVADLPEDKKDAGYLDYETHLAHAGADQPPVTVKPEDLYYIGYTSGTTSFPKGVVVRQDKFIEHAITCMLEYSRITEDDRFLLLMPLCHSNSIWFSSFMFMMGGYSYIYSSTGFAPAEVLQLIQDKKITMTSVVPTMLNVILNLPEDQAKLYTQDSLHTILVASSPLTTTTKEGTLRFFSRAQLYEAYGATEISMVTVLRPRFQWEKKRCIGRPQAFKEIKLLDEKGNEVPVGEPGELFVREYYNNPQAKG